MARSRFHFDLYVRVYRNDHWKSGDRHSLATEVVYHRLIKMFEGDLENNRRAEIILEPDRIKLLEPRTEGRRNHREISQENASFCLLVRTSDGA